MNERIQELARQSTGASTIYMLEEEWTKFAQLIVAECTDIAEQTRYDGKVVAERIKFVFGVKE